MFKQYILSKKQNIINDVCDLITYPSISIEEKNSHFPFGKDCADVLKHFLHLAESLGFKTKNLDNYCGYAEFGEGDEILGIIGHLDVVPGNEDDWSFSPFIPMISNNCIFGRGAIDDKGPVISSLYAMKAVMDKCKEENIKLNKRVRLIVGLNEEKDWKCIDYYKEHEEIPTIGFSPDADFPCIYAEKSVLSLLISEEIPEYSVFNVKNSIIRKPHLIHIEEIDDGNNAINVVPKYCSVTLKLDDSISIDNVISTSKSIIDKYKYEIDIYKIDEHKLKLTSHGVSAHSAHPELGTNAISKLILVLHELFRQYTTEIPLISNFYRYIGDDYLGNKLKLNFKDDTGHLTLNVSQFNLKENKLYIGINFRIPVGLNIDDVVNIFNTTFSKSDIDIIGKNNSLYIDKNDELVTTLCNIFNETCGTDFEPIAIGGATYARAFPNCISFGMNFPNDKDMCHQADEFIEIDKLILATNIYAKAIFELSSK